MGQGTKSNQNDIWISGQIGLELHALSRRNIFHILIMVKQLYGTSQLHFSFALRRTYRKPGQA